MTGTCTFAAKDEDGDGHPAFNCKATNGVLIQDGDDCNDHDANLYPGHPEPCSASVDGGVIANPCKQGLISCLSDGTESACIGTVVCTNQACVNQTCVGQCASGRTECVGNEHVVVERCERSGELPHR